MRAEVRFSAVHCAPAGDLLASFDVGNYANKQALLRQCMFVSNQMFPLPQIVRWLCWRGRNAACYSVSYNVYQL